MAVMREDKVFRNGGGFRMDDNVNWVERFHELMADPNSRLSRVFADVNKRLEYLDDPAISEHDKDLQYALDHEWPNPVELEEMYRKDLAIVDFSDPTQPHDQFECHGYDSLDDVRTELEELLSPEAMALRRAEYAKYQDLVAEALSKGFVKGGNCSKLRQ